jgi:glycosyltransferase involved in cell wall biosynthesis
MNSVIVPVFNEEKCIETLNDELIEVLGSMGESFEIIYVDDGSSDETYPTIKNLQKSDHRIEIISFVQNFGKSAVYTAGFEAAKGEIIITIDADLQDNPVEIPGLISELKQGPVDLVVGWKQKRLKNEPLKAVPSKVFNWLVSFIYGIELNDSNSGFRAMREEVALGIDLRGDLYRFIPQLAYMKGYRVKEVPVEHRKRKEGKSKYGPKRFWTGILDMITLRFITKYKNRPLHFLGTLGILPLIVGFGLEAYVLTM